MSLAWEIFTAPVWMAREMMQDWFGRTILAVIVTLIGLMGWAIYADAHDGVKCAPGHNKFSHFQPTVISTGKTVIVTQTPIYVCDLHIPAPEELRGK